MPPHFTESHSDGEARTPRLLDMESASVAGLDPHQFRSNLKSFHVRVATVFRDPAQLAPIFLDFCSLLHSLWDERRSGPNFVAPISSLTRRPSGRLSRLLLQHCRDSLEYESEDGSTFQESNPQTVAVIQLSKPPQKMQEIKADLHGLMSLLVFIEILILILLPSWLNRVSALFATLLVCAYATISGDGMLTLMRRTEETHDTLLDTIPSVSSDASLNNSPNNSPDTSTPGSGSCALLLGEELTVVVKGPEVIVEAITNGGFHLSSMFSDVLHRPTWNIARDTVLEGFFEGLLYSMALLLAQRLGLSLTLHHNIFLGLSLTVLSMMFRHYSHGSSAEERTAAVTPAGMEFLRTTARGIPFGGFLVLCMYTSAGSYVPRLGDLVQLAFLLNLLPFVSLAVILSIPSQNYPLQAARFFDVLGKPPVKKWQFKSHAAAATFQCLVLCDGLARPIKDIDVRGVLDTLILDQSGVWGAWKARVADRVAHEVDIISFVSTLPTFRDKKQQKQLQGFLDEAQSAYEKYRLAYFSDSQALQYPKIDQSS